MPAPCLYGPEAPGEITIDLAGREPAGLVAAFGSAAWTAQPPVRVPAAPGRLRTASASVCIDSRLFNTPAFDRPIGKQLEIQAAVSDRQIRGFNLNKALRCLHRRQCCSAPRRPTRS